MAASRDLACNQLFDRQRHFRLALANLLDALAGIWHFAGEGIPERYS